MGQIGLTIGGAPEGVEGGADQASAPAGARLRDIVDQHYAFVWRSLRRLGIPEGDVDDGAQKVFLTASRKLAEIRPGAEKSYLFQTALRVASDARRTIRRRREVPEVDAIAPADPSQTVSDAERIVDLRRARAALDRILDTLPLDLRAVFVLYELDEMPSPEIAALLDLPVGTVSSRLRRARVEFTAAVERLQRSERTPRGDLR